jgi:VWFA-related protein
MTARLCLAVAAGALSAGLQTVQQPQFRSSVDAVPVYVTVLDKSGRAVVGLKKEDFTVLDDGMPRPITVFSNERPHPLTAALMLDMSGGVNGTLWLQQAGETFVAAMEPGDRARIGTFGSEVAMSALLTGDKGFLIHVLHDELWPASWAPLFEPIDTAMTSLARETGRRVVVVVTTGGPLNVSERGPTQKTLLERVAREHFVVYGVSMRGWNFPTALRSIIEHSGGRGLLPRSVEDFGDALGTIVEELHAQYELGFVPLALDGKLHEIEVVVNYKDLDVYARQQYSAGRGSPAAPGHGPLSR